MAKKQPPQRTGDRLYQDLFAIGFVTLAAFVLAALLLGQQGHEPIVTRAISQALRLVLGVGAFGVPVVLFVVAIYYSLDNPPLAAPRALIGVGLLYMAVLTAVHLQAPHGEEFFRENLIARGGYMGAGLAWFFAATVGNAGAYIILSGFTAAAVILISQGTIPVLIAAARRLAGRGVRVAEQGVRTIRSNGGRKRSPRRPADDRPAKQRRSRNPLAELDMNDDLPAADDPRDAGAAEPAVEADDDPRKAAAPDKGDNPGHGRHMAAVAPEHDDEPEPVQPDGDNPQLKLIRDVVSVEDKSTGKAPAVRPAKRRPGEFKIPPRELLTAYKDEVETREDREAAADAIIKLEDTLESFGIHAKVTDYERGPVLTRYEIEPERGTRVSHVARHTDDIRMALAAWDIRIEAPIPGKSAIGIEVPNKKKATVGLRGLVESREFKEHKSEAAVCLGRDISGHPVIADLVEMPHLLVAGATNSGKSVCLHSIIVSLLMRATPDEVRLIMVDPKRVELNQYEGIPHLISPVVYTVQEAVDVLRKAIREMEKRLDKFSKVSAANIADYNFFATGARLAAGRQQITLDEVRSTLKLDEVHARRLLDMMEWGGVVLENDEPEEPWRVVIDANDARCETLPRLIIIIDELADLMMQARAEFEFSICRIAQVARATGIHLVIATQRPSVKVVTGNIKANIPSRIALSVASQVDSRTILDGQGAERLIGRGDMLFKPIDASKPRRAQGAFIARSEIEAVVEFLRSQGEPDYGIIPEVPEEDDTQMAESEHTDNLYGEAVRYVVAEGEASVSMLQRRFKVGYARAGRLVDMMYQRGVVGPSQGSKPRQVLIGSAYVDAALGGSAVPTGSSGNASGVVADIPDDEPQQLDAYDAALDDADADCAADEYAADDAYDVDEEEREP